jgi:hypothetical protein
METPLQMRPRQHILSQAAIDCPLEEYRWLSKHDVWSVVIWTTVVELTRDNADYIENFYNSARRHSSLDYLTPTEFEDLH